MTSAYALWANGSPVDPSLYPRIAHLEIFEHVERPGTLSLRLPLDPSPSGDLALVAAPMFRPAANLAVVVQAPDGQPSCVFDGYVLSQDVEIDPGATSASLTIGAQDATWLMGLEEKTREWTDVSDVDVAVALFEEHGITPLRSDGDGADGLHTEHTHTLMQRATDLAFLQQLARRSGKILRVSADAVPGKRIGTFASPDTGAEPRAVIALHGRGAVGVPRLRFSWDVSRPASVLAQQTYFDAAPFDVAVCDSASPALPLLGEQGLSDVLHVPMKTRLSGASASAADLRARTEGLLREAGFFVRCSAEVDAAALGAVIRPGTVALVSGAGSVLSGKYYVWSVRHTLSATAHAMEIELVRNALGAWPQDAAALSPEGGLP